MTKKTPETTKAPAERTDAAGNKTSEPVTKLVEIEHPEKLTNAEIKGISGDDGTDEAENSANRDVAEGLRKDRAEAKASAKGDTPERGYFHGHGGAAGEPG